MEKFNAWADKGCGVRPFIPKGKAPKLPIQILMLVFGFFKLIVAGLLFFYSFILFTIFDFLPIPYFSRFIRRLCSAIYTRIMLALFGLFHVKVEPTQVIRRVADAERWNKPGKGTLIIAQSSSYINALWLDMKLSPKFVVPGENGKVHVVSMHKLIINILRSKGLRSGEAVDLEKVMEGAKGPVVIFPEAAPTNGDGILKFKLFNAPQNAVKSVQIMGFKHNRSGISPCFVTGNAFVHLLEMLGSFVSSMEVKVACKVDSIQPKEGLTEEYINATREVLAKILRIPTLMLGEEDFHTFVVAAKDTSSTSHKTSKPKTD